MKKRLGIKRSAARHASSWVWPIIGALMLVLPVPTEAGAQTPPAGPPSLIGEGFYTFNTASDKERLKISATCDRDGTSSISYTAQGVATGPYAGKFKESGTYSIGPQTNPGAIWSAGTGTVMNFHATFTVDSPIGQVTGTKDLDVSTSFTANPQGSCADLEADELPAAQYVCDSWADERRPLAARLWNTITHSRYEARIETMTGVYSDSGTAFEQLLEYSVVCGNATTEHRDTASGFSQQFRTSDGVTPADVTPPHVEATTSAVPNAAGWYKHDATITWEASDASGTAPHPRDSVASTEGLDVLYTSEETCDAVGNCSTGTIRLSIDKTAPSVTATLEPLPNAHDWHHGDVVVSFVCDDALSGVSECPASVTLSSEAADQEVSGTAIDVAGNSATVTLSGIDIDRSDPAISAEIAPAPNENGWYVAAPVVTFTCNDGLSGIDMCGAPVTIAGEGAHLSVTGHALDRAGNSSSVTVSGISIDTTPPHVSYTGNAGTYSADDFVTIRCTATDELSGVSSGTCSDIRGPAYTFAVGTNRFRAEATDAAGNRTVESGAFEVVVTPAAVGNVIDEVVSSPKAADQLAKSLAKLEAAQGDPKKEAHALASFEKDIDKEIGKSLTAKDAELVKALARAL